MGLMLADGGRLALFLYEKIYIGAGNSFALDETLRRYRKQSLRRPGVKNPASEIPAHVLTV